MSSKSTATFSSQVWNERVDAQDAVFAAVVSRLPIELRKSNGGESASQSGAPAPLSENLLETSGPASESADAYKYGYADDTVVVLGYYLGYHFLLSFIFRICSSHTLSLLVLSSDVFCSAS